MVRARGAILKHGGAAHSNVFTRALLALFGEVPWSAVPVMPVEIMHLPRWFPFHLDKVSYWARTVLAPMMVVNAIKPRAKNPRDVHVSELFLVAPHKLRRWPGGVGQSKVWTAVFNAVDTVLRLAEPVRELEREPAGFEKPFERVESRRGFPVFDARDGGLGDAGPLGENALREAGASSCGSEHGSTAHGRIIYVSISNQYSLAFERAA